MSESDSDLVSVVVPVFNTVEYLPMCVESVLGQTHSQLELILVDDGSTDGSGVLCDDFASRDQRVRVVHKSNSGPSSARNTGVQVASGAYLAFVDSDDWIDPDCLAVLMSALDACGASMSMCATAVLSAEEVEQGEFDLADRCVTGRELLENPGAVYPIDTVSVCAKLISREVFGDLSFPVGRLHEDTYVSPQLYHRSKRVALVARPMYHYRQRPGSITWGTWSLSSRIDKARALLERARFLEAMGIRGRSTRDFIRGFSIHLTAMGESPKPETERPEGNNDQGDELAEQRALVLALAPRMDLRPRYRLAVACYRVLPGLTSRAYARLGLLRRNSEVC